MPQRSPQRGDRGARRRWQAEVGSFGNMAGPRIVALCRYQPQYSFKNAPLPETILIVEAFKIENQTIIFPDTDNRGRHAL
jgi:hypothetical protein